MKKKDLGDRIDRSAAAISQYESGKAVPSMETLQAMMRALDFPASFFGPESGKIAEVSLEGVHFRSNLDVPRIARQAACNQARIVDMVYGWLENLGIEFPESTLVKMESPLLESGMEEKATELRQSLGLGIGPIHDMADLLEGLGVRLIMLPESPYRLDAFATWIGGRPCIILDSGMPASRLQFNYAHELSHLLFDEESPASDKGIERKAHRFAGAFLMPAETFSLDCPQSYRGGNWLAVKRHWHVSIAAALYRARQLGLLGEKAYRSACVQRNTQGLREKEEWEFEPSMPTLLAQAMRMVSDYAKLEELENYIGIHGKELERILTLQGVDSDVIEKMRPIRPKGQILRFNPERKK